MSNYLNYALVTNFMPPAFHSYSSFSTLEECQKTLAADNSSVVKECVNNVSTQFIRMWEPITLCDLKNNRWCSKTNDTNAIIEGPPKAVFVAQSHLQKVMQDTSASLNAFSETNEMAIRATAFIIFGVLLALVYSAEVKKGIATYSPEAKKQTVKKQ